MELNKIIFTGIPTDDIINICCNKLKLFIVKHLYFFTINNTYTLQSAFNGISLECNNEIDYIVIFDYVINLVINNKIIKFSLLEENICNQIIYRNPKTFHQNNEFNRYIIYNSIIYYSNKIIDKNNLLLIGGECYIFSKLINYINTDIFSDYQSIVNDSKLNNPNANCYYVDYNDFQLNKNYNMCIINASKHSLPINLLDQLNKISINLLIFISCNEKNFIKDSKILKYNVSNKIIISPYVSLYIMESNKTYNDKHIMRNI